MVALLRRTREEVEDLSSSTVGVAVTVLASTLWVIMLPRATILRTGFELPNSRSDLSKEDEINGCKTRNRWQSHYSSLVLSIIYHTTPETKTKLKITIFASVDATKDQDGRKTSWIASQKDLSDTSQARFCWCLDS